MRINLVYAWVHDFDLSEPYTIAYETIDSVKNVFLQINTDSGISGFGCAAPDLEVTGETAESVMAFCNDVLYPSLNRQDVSRYALIIENLRDYFKTNPSALAMLDMALFDILAKRANLPLYRFLGGYRTSIPTSITIGILPVDDTVKKAEEFVHQGFKILKIKGGTNLEHDIEKINKIRERVGKKIEIRFDANQGYTLEMSKQFVNLTRNCKIALIEQPTPRKDFDLLKSITNSVHIPVMADESLMSLRDVYKMAKNDIIDMINIKLMKVGGISEAIRINAIARAANMEVMVGCMDESALAISAGLHFALARPNIEFADLDGHFDLIKDPTASAVILKKGVLYPNNKPGLGFNF